MLYVHRGSQLCRADSKFFDNRTTTVEVIMINTAATEEFAKVVRLGWELMTVCDFGIWGRKDDERGDV